MTAWDRVNKLELELAQAKAQLEVARKASVMLIDSLEAQRDQARSIAVRLEQELAHTEEQLATVHAQADRMRAERDRFAAAAGVVPVEGSVWLLEEEVGSE